ncbi:hypothetical protein U9M48_041521 [Paspalum notatum var. saurae]|uniref:Uncharacterized protein n=1 Tax=Paspalum notatum var. saurae TaxID=547442 RepID=A0AAQ3XE98_PASNO
MASAWPSSSLQLVLLLLDPWLNAAALRSSETDASSLRSAGTLPPRDRRVEEPPPRRPKHAKTPRRMRLTAPLCADDGACLDPQEILLGAPAPLNPPSISVYTTGSSRSSGLRPPANLPTAKPPPGSRQMVSPTVASSSAAPAAVEPSEWSPGVGGHLVAADGAGVAEREPGQDAVGVVDVGAGHLPRLGAEREGVLADGAVGVGGDVRGGDGDGRHGVDGGLGGGRVGGVAEGAARGEGARAAGGLDLRELLEEALEAGAHEEVGHAVGERAEAGAGAVVVEELEAAAGVVRGGVGGVVRVRGCRGRGAAEHDDGVEGGGAGGGGGVGGGSAAGAAREAAGVGVVVGGARAAEAGSWWAAEGEVVARTKRSHW